MNFSTEGGWIAMASVSMFVVFGVVYYLMHLAEKYLGGGL